MPQWDVVGVGANSVDYVYRLPAYPEPEGPRSKLKISSHRISCGGQIATTLSTCAAMGLRAKYVGAVGADGNGQRLLAELHHRGIDTSNTVVREALNAYAVILIAEDVGERVVLWDRSEALALNPHELPAEAIVSARALHVDDVDQDAGIAAARIARQAGVIVTSDIDRVTDRTEELIATVTIPIFAEHVPPALTGEKDPERALRRLRRTHAGRSARTGRCCSTATARTTSRRSRSRRSTRPAPATSSAAPSSSRCCAETRRQTSSGSPTPPPRSAAHAPARSTACRAVLTRNP
jgi:sugar/nucleoside kinase (ribokinase family)